MRAIASGVSLAEALHMDFRIVWLVNWEIRARFDEIFEVPESLKGKFIYPSSLAYSLLYSIPRKKNFYVSALTLKRFKGVFLDNSGDIEVSVSQIEGNNRKDYFIQAGTIFHDFSRELYQSLFHPLPEIQGRIDADKALLGKDYIGVHIRRTDNKESISHSPNSLFFEEIDKLPPARIYLATDDEETKALFKERYCDRVRFMTHPADRNSLDGIKDAIVDLWLLSGSKNMIGSYYSSFTDATPLLGDCKLTIAYKE